MKKLLSMALLALALFAGGCSFPISPLLFLLKNDPAPLHQPTPDSPVPVPTPETLMPAADNSTVAPA